MDIKELSLKGALLITPKIFCDNRGFFFESHHKEHYEKRGISSFVQDNHSYSRQGVIRGIHFQATPGQAKLVRVSYGKIFDVIVDIRPNSPTFGKWEGIYLDDEKHEQLFIPMGFAHGFQAISQKAHVLYKVSSFYDPKTEKSFYYNDPKVGIQWPLKLTCISKQDLKAPPFDEVMRR